MSDDGGFSPTDQVSFSLRSEHILVSRGALRAALAWLRSDLTDAFDTEIEPQRSQFVSNALRRLDRAADRVEPNMRYSLSMDAVELVAMRDAINTVIDLTSTNAGRNFLDDLGVYITNDEADDLMHVLSQTPTPHDSALERLRMARPGAQRADSFFTDTPPTEIRILNMQLDPQQTVEADAGPVERTLSSIQREMDARAADEEYQVEAFFLDFGQIIRQVGLAAAIQGTSERRPIIDMVQDLMPTVIGVSNRDDLITAKRGSYITDDLRDALFSASQGNWEGAANAANFSLQALAAAWEDYEREGPHTGPVLDQKLSMPDVPVSDPSDLNDDLFDVPYDRVTEHFDQIQQDLAAFRRGQGRSTSDFNALDEFSYNVGRWIEGVQASIGIRDTNEQENALTEAANAADLLMRVILDTEALDSQDETQTLQRHFDDTISMALEGDWDATLDAGRDLREDVVFILERWENDGYE